MYRILLLALLVGCVFPQEGAPADSEGNIENTDATCTPATFYPDADGDSFGDPNGSTHVACREKDGYVLDATDCDDADALVSPSSAETCDGTDNDCDDEIDENSAVDAPIWYRDADDDGLGTPDIAIRDCNGAYGYVPEAGDCNDADATIYGGSLEICNDIDDDCNGSIDDITTIEGTGGDTFYRDADGDFQGAPDNTIVACSAPEGYVEINYDCDDGDPNIRSTNGLEICDGVDNDCSGEIDDEPVDGETFFEDSDGDSFGNERRATTACDVAPAGYVEDNTDCIDVDPSTYPGAPEYCDMIDNDCNGVPDDIADENLPTWYADTDWDGYGDPNTTTQECWPMGDWTSDNTDCDDTDPFVNPGTDRDGDGYTACDDADDHDRSVN